MDNKEESIKPKTNANTEPVIYESWEEFWAIMKSEKFGVYIPINFLWSGDKGLEIELMSIVIGNLENRKIEECLIKGVSQEKFDEYIKIFKKLSK